MKGCCGFPWIYVVIHKSDLFLSWSWLEVSDRQSALTPPHPTHPSLTLCRLSTGSTLTFPWETGALSAAICLISYCNSQCKGERRTRVRERGRRLFRGATVFVTFCHINLFILAFLWGGKIAKTSTKAFQTCWLTLKKVRFQDCSSNKPALKN